MELRNGMLQQWGGQTYNNDVLPDHIPLQQRTDPSRRYTHIPEEFYSKTFMEVVTPCNFDQFIYVHKAWSEFHGIDLVWDLHERWSGSGRLSYYGFKRQLRVGFPVDYRYGWDLMLPLHRQHITRLKTLFTTYVDFNEPDCRIWSIASNRRDTQDGKRPTNSDTHARMASQRQPLPSTTQPRVC